MGVLDLIAVALVCASGVALYGLSRHYARLDKRDREKTLADARRLKLLMDEHVHDALSARDRCEAASRDVTSELAKRDHARVLARLEQLEAQVGIRRRT